MTVRSPSTKEAVELASIPVSSLVLIHGIGVSKRRYFLRESVKENLIVMNQIKDALDPLHILNDQKSYIGGHDHAEPV